MTGGGVVLFLVGFAAGAVSTLFLVLGLAAAEMRALRKIFASFLRDLEKDHGQVLGRIVVNRSQKTPPRVGPKGVGKEPVN